MDLNNLIKIVPKVHFSLAFSPENSYHCNYVSRRCSMGYRAYHKNKKTGVTYVYEATSAWDKEKKQPRNKQVCIGKLDPDTGAFIPRGGSVPSRRRSAIPLSLPTRR